MADLAQDVAGWIAIGAGLFIVYAALSAWLHVRRMRKAAAEYLAGKSAKDEGANHVQ